MPEGTAGDPDFAAVDAETSAPPVEQISRSTSPIVAGRGFPPVKEGLEPGTSVAAKPSPRRSLARRTGSGQTPATGAGNVMVQNPSGARSMGTPPAFSNPFSMNNAVGAAALPGAADAFASAGPGTNLAPGGGPSAGNRSMLVSSPRFKMQYAIEDAGPDGPAVVELWITQDGGRTWIRRAEDPTEFLHLTWTWAAKEPSV